MITELEAKKAFRRLAAVYRQPDDVPAALVEWVRVLGKVQPDDLERAVTEYLKTDATFWPTPGKIASIVTANREAIYWRPGPSTGPKDTRTKEEIRQLWIDSGALPPEYGQ